MSEKKQADANAEAPDTEAAESDASFGIGAALSTVLYAPLKVTYAGAGLLFGGLGWALSGGDSEIARAVIQPAVRGDYVVTPAHLRGERRLRFVGVPGDAGLEGALAGREAPEEPYGDPYPDPGDRYGTLRRILDETGLDEVIPRLTASGLRGMGGAEAVASTIIAAIHASPRRTRHPAGP